MKEHSFFLSDHVFTRFENARELEDMTCEEFLHELLSCWESTE